MNSVVGISSTPHDEFLYRRSLLGLQSDYRRQRRRGRHCFLAFVRAGLRHCTWSRPLHRCFIVAPGRFEVAVNSPW
uniref:Uncharacterized protein n=1 Tax=Physcomitrium patens TaxID=3218 RepID=A0A7I4D0R2_PHYPA